MTSALYTREKNWARHVWKLSIFLKNATTQFYTYSTFRERSTNLWQKQRIKFTCFSLTIIKFFQSQTHRKELKSHLLLGAKSIYSASSFRACHISINYSYPYSWDFVLCNFIGFESFEGLGACPTISHSTWSNTPCLLTFI